MSPAGTADVELSAGKLWGTLYYPILEMPDIQADKSGPLQNFDLISNMEFVADRFIKFAYYHHWDGYIFNRIPLLQRLKWREVTGFKFYYGKLSDHNYLNKFGGKRLPLVFFDRIYEDIETPRVVTNDYNSSFLATEHLIEQGCARIAYLVVNKSLSIGKTRMQGYIDALEKHNLPFEENLIVDCSNSYEENSIIIKAALTDLKPDGIFTSVERLAFATYYACYDLNISIPQDVKIISFSSLEIAPLLNPSLTTITQPATEIGTEAARMLFNVLSSKGDKKIPSELVLQSKIIKRNSTSNSPQKP